MKILVDELPETSKNVLSHFIVPEMTKRILSVN